MGVGNFVNAEKVTELLVMLFFDDSALFTIDNHAVILFLFKIIDDFAEFKVGDKAFLDGVELNILFDFSFFCVFVLRVCGQKMI